MRERRLGSLTAAEPVVVTAASADRLPNGQTNHQANPKANPKANRKPNGKVPGKVPIGLRPHATIRIANRHPLDRMRPNSPKHRRSIRYAV